MIIRVHRALIDLLTCLEPKLWPKNTVVHKNTKNCMSLPLAAGVARDNSPREYAREVFEPSKDSWSVPVCTEKKLLRFGFGVFGGCRQKEGRSCIFLVILLWRHHPDNEPKWWLKIRAVESEVPSSDSDSDSWQFRLSDSDSNSDSDSGPTPTFSCISYLKW